MLKECLSVLKFGVARLRSPAVQSLSNQQSLHSYDDACQYVIHCCEHQKGIVLVVQESADLKVRITDIGRRIRFPFQRPWVMSFIRSQMKILALSVESASIFAIGICDRSPNPPGGVVKEENSRRLRRSQHSPSIGVRACL